MSYTMTLDMPQTTAEYVKSRGPCFRDELNALLLAFVTVRMQADSEMSYQTVETKKSDNVCPSGLDLFNALRACASILDDDEMHIFDRVKDYGRKVDLV